MAEPYAPLDATTLPARLGAVPALRERLGEPATWRACEVGDGNLNLVFVVEGAATEGAGALVGWRWGADVGPGTVLVVVALGPAVAGLRRRLPRWETPAAR